MHAPIELRASELSKSITVDVKIKGFKGWMFRLKIAFCLLRLAAMISGMGIEIESDHADAQS